MVDRIVVADIICKIRALIKIIRVSFCGLLSVVFNSGNRSL